MFSIVVQKEFLETLYVEDNGDLLYKGFELFIKEVKAIDIITDLSEMNLFKELKGNPFWKLLTENIRGIKFDFSFEREPLKQYMESCDPFCFFLIKPELNEIVKDAGFPYLNASQFERWAMYDTRLNPKRWRVSSADDGYSISSWDKLSELHHDFHSLILVDFFSFSKSMDRQEKGWIAALLAFQKGNDSLNTRFLILPREDQILDGKEGKKRDEAIVASKGKFSTLVSQYKRNNLKSTVILLPKSKKVRDKKIHDRYIVTNSFYLSVGAGFDAIEADYETEVESKFVFYPEIMFDIKERVSRLSSYVEKLEHIKGSRYVEASKMWVGEKRLRFFNVD